MHACITVLAGSSPYTTTACAYCWRHFWHDFFFAIPPTCARTCFWHSPPTHGFPTICVCTLFTFSPSPFYFSTVPLHSLGRGYSPISFYPLISINKSSPSLSLSLSILSLSSSSSLCSSCFSYVPGGQDLRVMFWDWISSTMLSYWTLSHLNNVFFGS